MARGTGSAGLLLVPLDLSGRARYGGVGVFTELAPCPPLAQQVPALIERLFSGTKTLAFLFRAELTGGQLAAQFVFGLD